MSGGAVRKNWRCLPECCTIIVETRCTRERFTKWLATISARHSNICKLFSRLVRSDRCRTGCCWNGSSAGRGDGDSASAFAALVERHGPMVLGVCRDVLHDFHDAEDAAQATFLVLARNAGSIRWAESVGSWLFGVALRVAARSKADVARRRAIERRAGEMSSRHAGNGPVDLVADLLHELGTLPERYRAPIVLCHLEGFSNEQAAGQLGLPVRTVQRRLSQGRERLRARLVRRGADPAVGVLGPGFAPQAATEAWLEATVDAACGLGSGQQIGAVATSAVAVLTQGR